MRSLGINGEGESKGQPANPGSPGKMECACNGFLARVTSDECVICL